MKEDLLKIINDFDTETVQYMERNKRTIFAYMSEFNSIPENIKQTLDERFKKRTLVRELINDLEDLEGSVQNKLGEVS